MPIDNTNYRVLANWLAGLPRHATVLWAAAGGTPTDDLPVVFDRFTDANATDFTSGLLIFVAGENYDKAFPEDLGRLGTEAAAWTVPAVTDAIAYWVTENTGRADLTFEFNPFFPTAVALIAWAATLPDTGPGYVLAAG